MAKRQTTEVTDDLDGTVLQKHETILYALDGKQYEIDLSPENAEQFRADFDKYVSVSRQIARNGSPYSKTVLPSEKDKRARTRELAKIRDWAQSQGMKVSDRGRIAADVVEAYEAANS